MVLGTGSKKVRCASRKQATSSSPVRRDLFSNRQRASDKLQDGYQLGKLSPFIMSWPGDVILRYLTQSLSQNAQAGTWQTVLSHQLCKPLILSGGQFRLSLSTMRR